MCGKLNRLWVCGLLAVAVAGVAVTVGVVGPRADRLPIGADSLGHQPNRFATDHGETAPRDEPPLAAVATATAPASVPTLHDLQRLCPNPWTDLPEECSRALDRRYMPEGAREAHLHDGALNWIPKPEPLSHEIPWRDAFADPVGTRVAVGEALANPDCLHPVEGSVALREQCAADEIAKLAMIVDGCTMPLIMAGLLDSSSPAEQEPVDSSLPVGSSLGSVADQGPTRDEVWWWHVEQLDDDASLTPAEYWRRRNDVEDGRFRFAWRLNRCRKLPREALHWLSELPQPTGHFRDVHQGAHLRAVAARLGNDWAIALATGENAPVHSEEESEESGTHANPSYTEESEESGTHANPSYKDG
ncbi:MAG: hypothetical protein OXK76_03430 [Gammaproteobacteria bacterium]|nr:hypothetical protein [Gammaproteobacteria bacterium]